MRRRVKSLEVFVLDRVLGRDDEAELMAVALGALEERYPVGPVVRCVIEVARQPLAGDAVPLEIAEMNAGATHAVSGELDQPRLDHDPSAAEGGMAIARRQHPADTRAAPDAAAIEDATARRCAAAPAPTGTRDCPLDLAKIGAADTHGAPGSCQAWE